MGSLPRLHLVPWIRSGYLSQKKNRQGEILREDLKVLDTGAAV